jgi:hypothetical protein
MSSSGLREILEYTLDEEKLVDKLCDRLFAIGVNVRSIAFRDVTDAQEVITKLSLAIWDEFEIEFLQFVKDNNFDIDEEDFCIDFNALKLGHYTVSYGNSVYELDKFVDEISDWNRERVFKEMAEYLGLK